jgi:hypothetical protein
MSCDWIEWVAVGPISAKITSKFQLSAHPAGNVITVDHNRRGAGDRRQWLGCVILVVCGKQNDEYSFGQLSGVGQALPPANVGPALN